MYIVIIISFIQQDGGQIMYDYLYQPWPWYIAGPILGLIVPVLLIAGGKVFGISSSLRHACSACGLSGLEYFRYDWKKSGLWNLVFVAGIMIGGFLGGYLFVNPEPINISESTISDLTALGITNFNGFVPPEIFNWAALGSGTGIVVLVLGGFLVGFGARYAGGCTSGHGISGLANMQFASLMAVTGFFTGGIIMTYLVLPYILGGVSP